MLELDFLQLNIGMHPSKAVTLVHHVETLMVFHIDITKHLNIRLN